VDKNENYLKDTRISSKMNNALRKRYSTNHLSSRTNQTEEYINENGKQRLKNYIENKLTFAEMYMVKILVEV
jgi:hypothetical protein